MGSSRRPSFVMLRLALAGLFLLPLLWAGLAALDWTGLYSARFGSTGSGASAYPLTSPPMRSVSVRR